MENKKVVRKQNPRLKGGYWEPYFSRTNNIFLQTSCTGHKFKKQCHLKT